MGLAPEGMMRTGHFPPDGSGCLVSDSVKVVYAGLPGSFCENCHVLSGPAAWAADLIGFDGVMLVYEGSYLRALWAWIWTPLDEGP